MRRVLVAPLLTAIALLAWAGPALAHAALVGSDPADGASLAASPQQVELTFSEPVRAGFSRVTVVGPDGRHWHAAGPTEAGAVVSVPVQPLGAAGEYTIGYRVLSADSHPVQGSVSFTLTEPGPAASPASSPVAAPDAPAQTDGAPADGADPPVWPWLVGAGVLLGIGVAAAVRFARLR